MLQSAIGLTDVNGHTSLYAGEYDVILSRGHGVELQQQLHASTPDDKPVLQKEFRKWW